MYQKYVKRFLDVLLASILLLVSLPVLLLVSVALAVANRGSILFRQQRPGWLGRPMFIYKFKTMSDARDAQGRLLPDAERLTAVGLWIRKTSLDELPQLYNVLKGDLSLVGPRPLLMEYLPLYNQDQARRHDVKPGITGWAQINGRNAIAWEQKFDHDLWYVENLSFKTDALILAKTIKKVWNAADVQAPGHATTPKFEGNKTYA
jgi:lipopolysaccharide/colanic/teichoic acid biosynthesis glycosyltransferase